MADCSQRQRPGDTQIGNVVDGKAKQCALGVAAVSSSQPVEQGLHAVRLERGVGERLLGDASAKLFQATGVRPDARKLEKLCPIAVNDQLWVPEHLSCVRIGAKCGKCRCVGGCRSAKPQILKVDATRRARGNRHICPLPTSNDRRQLLLTQPAVANVG